MKDPAFSRRAAILGSGRVPDDSLVRGQSRPRADRDLQCEPLERRRELLCQGHGDVIKSGGDTLDAVIAGVNIVELDPRDTSVGYGGLPNEEGVVELDASCMHGPSRRGGAVGALRGIKTPSKVAKRVMEDTDHMMLVGAGALKFAKAEGFRGRGSVDRGVADAMAGLEAQSVRDRHGHSNWGPGLDAPPEQQK